MDNYRKFKNPRYHLMKKDSNGKILFVIVVLPPTPYVNTENWHINNIDFLRKKLGECLTKEDFMSKVTGHGWREFYSDGNDFYLAV